MPSGIRKDGSKLGFQKGYTPWNKGIKTPNKENSNNWKGENASFQAKHIWIRRNYGNPIKCKDCGKIGEKIKNKWNIDWSNKDHKYKRDKNDYIGRCEKCHRIYDIKMGFVGFNKKGRPIKIIRNIF